jgi:23S rRNA pseudouridine1911/1915/1917 synthase
MPHGPAARTQTFVVSPPESRRPLAALLRARLRLSWSEVRRLLREHRVRLNGALCLDPSRRLKPGQRVQVQAPDRNPSAKAGPSRSQDQGPRTKDQGPSPVIRFADADVVVVEKPAGLTTVRHADEAAEFGRRAQRFLPPTLADLLPGLLAAGRWPRPRRLRAVHRLDKDTSGLVVFAGTAEAERHLGFQFRAHTTARCYQAVVRGNAKPGRIESRLVRDRGDGRRGSTDQAGEGQRAVTNVRVVEELGDYTLVECRLETGRTHQVRIHLGEAGTPLCGERVYDRPLNGKPLPDGSNAPRLALHAAELGLDHPRTGKRMTWTSPLPADLAALLGRLRSEKTEG